MLELECPIIRAPREHGNFHVRAQINHDSALMTRDINRECDHFTPRGLFL
jgi:hypothetical protein